MNILLSSQRKDSTQTHSVTKNLENSTHAGPLFEGAKISSRNRLRANLLWIVPIPVTLGTFACGSWGQNWGPKQCLKLDPSLLRHEARPQFGAPFQGQNWAPVSVPCFGFKNAPTSANVDHLPRDKFSVDRFAFCMSLMVMLANCSHSSLHPLQNQRERFNQKRNSNWGSASTRRQVWPCF